MTAPLTAADARRLLDASTPGPWAAHRFDEEDGGIVWQIQREPVGPVKAPDFAAVVGYSESDLDNPRAAADARIFAAAPDLAAALIEAEAVERRLIESWPASALGHARCWPAAGDGWRVSVQAARNGIGFDARLRGGEEVHADTEIGTMVAGLAALVGQQDLALVAVTEERDRLDAELRVVREQLLADAEETAVQAADRVEREGSAAFEEMRRVSAERDRLARAASALLALYDSTPGASDGDEADAAWAELRAATGGQP